MPYSIVIAGSTARTRLCAEALGEDSRFEVIGVLTPSPRAVGRQQVITNNPLHALALEHDLPIVSIDTKINERVRDTLRETFPAPDFLLVVDFGYIVPQWLLDWPSIAPVNIHPSDLPKYRGSSPGQFALIFGEETSAVTIMQMDAKLDHGPVITSQQFQVDPEWTSVDYYEHAFSLATSILPDTLARYATDQKSVPQPDESPTPVARMLRRDDGFVPFETFKALVQGNEGVSVPIPFLELFGIETNKQTLYNLWRGLTPWPGLWTTIPKDGQEKRMKLLSFHMNEGTLYIDEVQIEGKNKQSFETIQSLLDD